MRVGIFPAVYKVPMQSVPILQVPGKRILYLYDARIPHAVFYIAVYAFCFEYFADGKRYGVLGIAVIRFTVYVFIPISVYTRNIVISCFVARHDYPVHLVLTKHAVGIEQCEREKTRSVYTFGQRHIHFGCNQGFGFIARLVRIQKQFAAVAFRYLYNLHRAVQPVCGIYYFGVVYDAERFVFLQIREYVGIRTFFGKSGRLLPPAYRIERKQAYYQYCRI